MLSGGFDEGAGLLIHVGYGKTASTYLQTQIFYEPGLGFGGLEDADRILEAVRNPQGGVFDAEAVRTDLEQQTIAAGVSGLAPVLSAEDFSGYMIAQGFDGRKNLERLVQIAPKAKILIVLREQESMLLSRHNQLIKTGGTMSLAEYVGDRSDPSTHGYRSQLLYDRLIAAYQAAFGKESVLVLPYEMLRSDRSAFVNAIAGHCGIATICEQKIPGRVVNRSRSQLAKAILKRTNRIVAQAYRTGGVNTPLIPLRKPLFKRYRAAVDRLAELAPQKWSDTMQERDRRFIREQVGDYYAESNRETRRLTGLALGDCGYTI